MERYIGKVVLKRLYWRDDIRKVALERLYCGASIGGYFVEVVLERLY